MLTLFGTPISRMSNYSEFQTTPTHFVEQNVTYVRTNMYVGTTCVYLCENTHTNFGSLMCAVISETFEDAITPQLIGIRV